MSETMPDATSAGPPPHAPIPLHVLPQAHLWPAGHGRAVCPLWECVATTGGGGRFNEFQSGVPYKLLK